MAAYPPLSDAGLPGGCVLLDGTGKVPVANLPDGGGTTPDATTTLKGKVELATDGESAPDVVVQGNDSRLSNARTPTTHSHAPTDVTGTAVITADSRLSDARTPLSHTHPPSDVTGTAVITSDSRLSDARTPLSHSHIDADLPAGLARDSEVTAAVAAHAGANTHTQIDSHLASTANPHATTAAQAGALATSAFSGLTKITVGTSTPGSPSTGDLWIDTN